MKKKSKKSTHILNASSTLLGFCFVVMTSFRLKNTAETTILDELTAVANLFFMASCILSFLSIRSNRENGDKYERFADYIFLIGLGLLTVITILITLHFIE